MDHQVSGKRIAWSSIDHSGSELQLNERSSNYVGTQTLAWNGLVSADAPYEKIYPQARCGARIRPQRTSRCKCVVVIPLW